MTVRAPTKAEQAALSYLLAHPGETVFDYYDDKSEASWGMRRVSLRGAAGRMRWRLHDEGWITHDQIVTAAGESAAAG
jgi:hypothetical protein